MSTVVLAGSILPPTAVLAGLAETPQSGRTPTSHGCGGHERWSVKVLIDPDAEKVNFKPRWRSIDTLRGFVRPPGSLKGAPRTSSVEFATYQVRRVFLVEAKREKDKDIHLVIRDRHESHTMIVEFPDVSCPDAASSFKAPEMGDARAAFIAACGNPSSSKFTQLTGRATIEGVGFFDVVHSTPQRGRAPNNIELHPVLRFESADCKKA